jgi:hypothetical protein
MLKAADLLVHDGNLPFVLLDATGVARRDLNSLPAAAWWRLKSGRGDGIAPVTPPTPPDMRVRIRRFLSDAGDRP